MNGLALRRPSLRHGALEDHGVIGCPMSMNGSGKRTYALRLHSLSPCTP